MSEKLQKVLARAGLGSRRQMEKWISEGRVKVNGKIADLGMRVDKHDTLAVDGRPLRIEEQKPETRILLYHKVAGEMCTRKDPEGRPTVYDKLPRIRPGRWISIGRLDYHTAGLLIFTNNGDLANQLMHPSTQLEREYAVRTVGQLTPEVIAQLQQGVSLEDGNAFFESVLYSGGQGLNHWYHVVVKEGRNRLVRRLFESQNITISRLIRVRFGSTVLPRRLPQGRMHELDKKEVKKFLSDLNAHRDQLV